MLDELVHITHPSLVPGHRAVRGWKTRPISTCASQYNDAVEPTTESFDGRLLHNGNIGFEHGRYRTRWPCAPVSLSDPTIHMSSSAVPRKTGHLVSPHCSLAAGSVVQDVEGGSRHFMEVPERDGSRHHLCDIVTPGVAHCDAECPREGGL